MSGILNNLTLQGNLQSLATEKKADPFFKAVQNLTEEDLDYPQNICLEGPWASLAKIKKLQLESMTRKHPFFKPLRKKITHLKNQLKTVSQEKVKAIEVVVKTYESFIQNVIKKQGKERTHFIKGDAYLHLEDRFYKVEQKLARKLGSLNTYGEVYKSNEYGSSAVFFHNGIHFKRPCFQPIFDPLDEKKEQLLPLRPGYEYAVYSLDDRLHSSSVIAPIRLIKISNIFAKQAFHPQAKQSPTYQKLLKSFRNAKHGQSGITHFFKKFPQEKAEYPFQLMRKHVIVQASHTIKGQNLRDFIQSGHAEQINVLYFGQICFMQMLMSPWDARSDNFMVDKENNKIVGIDNDGMFADTHSFHPMGKYFILRIFSVIFLFPQMRLQVDEKLKKNYRNHIPEEVLIDWIYGLHEKNKEFMERALEWKLSQEDLENLQFPMTFELHKISAFYQRLVRLHKVLLKDHITYWDVFKALFPLLYPVYSKIAEQQKDILDGQKALFNNIVKLKDYLPESQLAKLKKEEPTSESMQPLALMEKMLPQLAWNSLPQQTQKHLLVKIVSQFKELKTLHLKGFSLVGKEIELALAPGSYTRIILESCKTLTHEIILRIVNKNKNLEELILKDFSHISLEGFKMILDYFEENNLKLTLDFEGTRCRISQGKLDEALLPSLQAGRTFEADYLVRLGSQMKKDDSALVHEICKSGQVKSVQWVLEKGFSPHLKDEKMQSLLHIAAQLGYDAIISSLISYKANINEAGPSGRTPLHYSAFYNRISSLKLLLQAGANPEITETDEKQNILHIGAAYGYHEFLKAAFEAMPPKQWSQLINQGDFDGKTPLHKAMWGREKKECVQFLLEHGANVNQLSLYKYTPLHWASKHGHLESAKLLLANKARIDIINANGDMPFDLAIGWGQDAIVRFFLGLKPLENPSTKLSLYLLKLKLRDSLIEALKSDNRTEQIACFLNLGHFLIQEKKSLMEGAQFLNSALHLAPEAPSRPGFERYLLNRLERVEGLFLESKGRKIPASYRGHVAKNRTSLKKFRESLKTSNTREMTPLEFKNMSETHANQVKSILKQIVLSAAEVCGTLPCPYSIVVLDSLARGEVLPFPDFQFAILIKEETPKSKAYFKLLAQLIEFKIINLGETSYQDSDGLSCPQKDGLHINRQGKIPSGTQGVYELIRTPSQMANLLKEEWIAYDLSLPTAIQSSSFLAGDQKLFTDFQKSQQSVLTRKSSGWFSGTFGKTLAFHKLSKHTKNLKASFARKSDSIDLFQERYMPFTGLISSLSLHYGITELGTLAQIEKLRELNKLSALKASQLNQAFQTIHSLCIQTQYHHQGHRFLLLKENNKDLAAVDRILQEFVGNLEKFLKSPNSKYLK